jgi:GcrA cell cycle regulator
MNTEATCIGVAPTGVRSADVTSKAITAKGVATGVTSGVTWTTERVERLRSYVTAGLTCSQIAGEIGVSRNAVIGKIHRLGLTTSGRAGRRPSALAQRMRTAPAREPGRRTLIARILRASVPGPTIAPVEATVELAPVESTQRCSLLDLAAGGCRWPIGDPGKTDFGFCGHDAITGLSYCAGHARLAYRLPSGRRA